MYDKSTKPLGKYFATRILHVPSSNGLVLYDK